MAKGERIGKFWFSPNLPEEIKLSCKELLVKNASLIPNWCNEVRVVWDEEGLDIGAGSASAHIGVSYSYRNATMYLCPPFLSEDKDDREIIIKHELCHIISFPLLSYVRELGNILGEEDDKINKIISREMGEKIESMTEDLSFIIQAVEDSKSNDNPTK